MADTNESHVNIEDIQGVRSRVSWAAVLGGAVIALAVYLVLTFFFAALGLSLTEAGVRDNAVGTGAVIAAVLTIVIALYLGGWVTTQLSVGETKQEACIYGVLTWAVVMAFSVGLIGMGVRAGYFALVSGTVVAQNAGVTAQNWEQAARSAGVPQQRIDEARAAVDPNRAVPVNEERVREAAAVAAWSAFAGTLLSIAACVFGSLAGRGAVFRLFPVTRVQHRGEIIIP